MVKEHSLSDPDDGVAIFTESARKEIEKLDATDSRAALTAIINCLSSPVPRNVIEKTYETCEELQQLRQGHLRLYVTLVTALSAYDVLWVFAVKKHQYRNLGKFDAEACRKVVEIRNRTDGDEVERYLARNDALTLDELTALREEV